MTFKEARHLAKLFPDRYMLVIHKHLLFKENILMWRLDELTEFSTTYKTIFRSHDLDICYSHRTKNYYELPKPLKIAVEKVDK